MAILNMRAIQEADTNLITDYEITFKKIRTASTILVEGSLSATRAATQSAPNNNNGSSGPTGDNFDFGTYISAGLV
jgi:hypothetical protein